LIDRCQIDSEEGEMLERAREKYGISSAHHAKIIEQLEEEDPRKQSMKDPLSVVRSRDDGLRRVYSDCHPYKKAVKKYFLANRPSMTKDTIDRPLLEGMLQPCRRLISRSSKDTSFRRGKG
jgi:hypothetical protein